MAKILIQCVVVLYKQSPNESIALSSLLQICNSEPTIARHIAILIHDNSPVVHEFPQEDQNVRHHVLTEYRHSPANPGLAHAYNTALDLAKERKIPWLLLLDQDTRITRQFLVQLRDEIQGPDSKRYCAVVPQLVSEDLVLSPQVVGCVSYRRMPPGFSGLAAEEIVAFNSAACIRVRDLEAIAGFPTEFWLDYLDHTVFHRLQKAGGRVLVLNSQLSHGLALQNIETEVSHERYANVLRAEWMFVRQTRWGGGPSVHRLRLLKRGLSQYFKLRDKSYALQTLHSAVSSR